MSDPTQASATRNDGLDVLRGLFLLLMTVTHLPTGFSSALTQPFGQVSAAEGFVLLSAFLAGRVYLRRGRREGVTAMRHALWERAATVYSHHLGLLVFALAVALPIGLYFKQGAIIGAFHLFLREPAEAGLSALLLTYQPPLLDILPMYVLFLLFTPALLVHVQRHGWQGPLLLSVALWAAAQIGLREVFHGGWVQLTGTSLPIGALGSFNAFAWQLLWVIGLWLGGATVLGAPSPLRADTRQLRLLALLAASFLLWRQLGGWHPFGDDAPSRALSDALIGKWTLAPLRLLNVLTVAVLIAAWGPALQRRIRLGWLALLGRSSLPVFSAHLVCCLLVLAWFGPGDRANGSLMLDLSLLGMTLLVMQTTALIAQRREADAARLTAPSGGA